MSAPSREAQMVVIERGPDGTPTVWCDPEIADLVRALNAGGIRTVASCSGHSKPPLAMSMFASKADYDAAIRADHE